MKGKVKDCACVKIWCRRAGRKEVKEIRFH